MSTLKVNTIQNTSAAHSSTPEQLSQGRAKVWIRYGIDGSGVSVQDSFGVYLECIETRTPIISTHIYDKSDIVIDNEMGKMINTPFQLYDFEKFGTKWKNWEEFNKCFVS